MPVHRALTAAAVLVVDDEPGIARVLTTALTGRGYRVIAVGTGQAALDGPRCTRPTP